MRAMSDKLKKWLEQATTSEAATLAELAKTSRVYLYQIAAGGSSSYGRDCGPDLAARLEHAASLVRANNPHLPVLLRTDLCPACAACEYARECQSRRHKTKR